LWWGRNLVFTSRSRGEVSRLDLGPDPVYVSAAAFRPSGKLRLARQRQVGQGSTLEFIDVDPGSGATTVLASLPSPGGALRLDSGAERALITSSTQGGRASISMIDLRSAPGATPIISLVAGGINPAARFLGDGRIAATTNEHEGGVLRVFSPTGERLLDLPQPGSAMIAGEMFEGLLAIGIRGPGVDDLCLIDAATGAKARCLQSLSSPLALSPITPPPGSPAARLLQSSDGKLYELPSLTAEPRLLLPLGTR
jgi:hypothetical protein